MKKSVHSSGDRCALALSRAASVVLALLAALSTARAAPDYQIQELVPLPGIYPIAQTHDISSSGQAVGRTWKEEGPGIQNHHGVLWSAEGQPTDLGANGYWSEAFGISNTGFIAGRHDVGSSVMGALWSPNLTRSVLPPLPGDPAAWAYDVDDVGVAVGFSVVSLGGETTAVRWIQGQPQILAGANDQSYAFAVNGAGAAVGRRDVPAAREAMLWEGDAFTVLPDLGGALGSATNISENGTICGGAMDEEGRVFPVIWDRVTHEPSALPEPPSGVATQVEDVNDAGLAVGYMCLSFDCGPGETRALLWSDGEVYDLNDRVPPGSGWTLFTADAINEAGEIVGTGALSGVPSIRAYKLTPNVTEVSDLGPGRSSLRIVPNPSREESEIFWRQSAVGPARLELLDVTGRSLARVDVPTLPGGERSISLQRLTGYRALPSGVYLVSLRTADGTLERTRVTLIR